MKPFAQKQNPSGRRWLLFVGVLAAAFGVWHFELIPELRPVPSGQVGLEADPSISELPNAWDEIVDHTDRNSVTPAGDHDELLSAIIDDADPLDRVLNDLSEPEIGPPEPGSVAPAGGIVTHSGSSVENASFRPQPGSADPAVDSPGGVVPAIGTADGNVVLSAETAEALRSADKLIGQARIVEAHHLLSTLYWKQTDQRPVFLRRLESVAAEIFEDPHQHIGEPYLVIPGDTLESIGDRYKVPWQYLARLNRIEPQELQAGQELKVMQGPFSAVVDLSRFELTIHAHGYFVKRYEVGIGEGSRTPAGDFTVQEKLENPTWYNPDGGQVDRDDPQNPLGEYWIGLGDHIGIHGTIDPESIGTARSRGCVHMRDDDIAEVFGYLGHGSAVRIRP